MSDVAPVLTVTAPFGILTDDDEPLITWALEEAESEGIATIHFDGSSAFGSVVVDHDLPLRPAVVLATVEDGISGSLIGGINASAYSVETFTLALWLADLSGALAPPDPGDVTVAWVAIPPGSIQQRYQVRIFDAATYGAGGFDPDVSDSVEESGIVASSEDFYPLAEPLDDGAYRAYVRASQLVGTEEVFSEWAFSDFTIDAERPAVPELSLEAEPTAARIRIEITAGAGGAVSTDGFEIERSDDDDGESFERIRTVEGDGFEASSAGGARAFDFEAPNGTPVTYRVRAVHIAPDGRTHSPFASADAVWESSKWWLKHPTDPALSLAIPRYQIASEPGSAKGVRQGVFQALGRSDPIVVSDRRGPHTGTLQVGLDGDGQAASLDELLDSTSPLLIQAPAGDHWPDRWVSVGESGRERAVDQLAVDFYIDTLPWTELARPDGDLLAWPSTSPAGPTGDDLILL